MFPRPEVKAWRSAVRRASHEPRYTAGRIQLLDYDLEYTDLCTLCPQWNDLFVREAYRFDSAADAPRILDLGANVGLASLYFKRRYPDARITAYEADPAICEVLRRNLRANGAHDVEVVNAAAWVRDGEVAFDREGADSGAVAGENGGPARATTTTVPARRLRDELGREEFDLVKLDIEGAELRVLEDCRDALDRVSTLIMEVHEWKPEERITPTVLRLLADAGFRYTLDDLTPLPWREPVASSSSPFSGRALCWVYLVRAFRPVAQ
jgi:FkbM family methyltransferase